jgi:hypothetical protein
MEPLEIEAVVAAAASLRLLGNALTVLTNLVQRWRWTRGCQGGWRITLVVERSEVPLYKSRNEPDSGLPESPRRKRDGRRPTRCGQTTGAASRRSSAR